MDSLITAAARALASGDALGALKLHRIRDDPPALALRGIAMAQLGDLTAHGKVQAVGRGRARRWMTPPVPGFPTTLLLPAALPGG